MYPATSQRILMYLGAKVPFSWHATFLSFFEEFEATLGIIGPPIGPHL